MLPSGSAISEKSATVTELSLSGALIEGLPYEGGEMFLIKIKLPDFGEIEGVGETVRKEGEKTAFRINWPDTNILAQLWRYIRENLDDDGSCPYCGSTGRRRSQTCARCGYYLCFEDEAYLEKHLKKNLLARMNGLESFDLTQILKLISFTTRELMKIHGTFPEKEFVGTSPAMLKVFSMIRKVAATEMNVLILGESGTGKELTAKAIHERSDRKNKPLVVINCAAIPEGLLEAELFGYEKGAFTGACAARKGKFEVADQGTLFLDEIGDLPPSLQAKLLRFFEDRVVERIGGKGSRKVDVRIIAATNCDLDDMVENGNFRNDLFFRLNAFSIKLPPLRERDEDIVVLARYFLKKFASDGCTSPIQFSEKAIEAIRGYSWPGNVREMINKVRRSIVMAGGAEIEPSDLELDTAGSVKKTLKSQVSKNQKDLVQKALEEHGYVISRTARALGVSRPSIYSMIKKYGIPLPGKQVG